jgi:hypothetical protein
MVSLIMRTPLEKSNILLFQFWTHHLFSSSHFDCHSSSRTLRPALESTACCASSASRSPGTPSEKSISLSELWNLEQSKTRRMSSPGLLHGQLWKKFKPRSTPNFPMNLTGIAERTQTKSLNLLLWVPPHYSNEELRCSRKYLPFDSFIFEIKHWGVTIQCRSKRTQRLQTQRCPLPTPHHSSFPKSLVCVGPPW